MALQSSIAQQINRSIIGAPFVIPPDMGGDDGVLIDLRQPLPSAWSSSISVDAKGTFFDSTGLLKSATANKQRITFDPNNLKNIGTLIEESRSTFNIRSNIVNWSTTQIGNTIVDNFDFGIDGTLSAQQVTVASGADNRVQQNTVIPDDNTVYFRAHYIKKTSGNTVFPALLTVLTGGATTKRAITVVNTNTGVITANSGDVTNSDISSAGNYWRVWQSVTNNTSGNITLAVSYYAAWCSDGTVTQSNPGGVSIVCDAEVGVGAFPTSPILMPTTSNVARAADAISIPLANLGIPANPNALTIIGKARTSAGADSVNLQYIFQIDDGGVTNRLFFRRLNTTGIYSFGGAGGTGTFPGGLWSSPTNNTDFRFYVSIDSFGCEAQIIGQTLQSSNGTLGGGFTTLRIGAAQGNTSPPNAPIGGFQIFNRRLSSTEASARAAAFMP